MSTEAHRVPFQLPRVIFAAGNEDAAFIRELLNARRIFDWDVRSNLDYGTGGDSGFRRALEGAETLSGFERVQRVAMLLDADDDRAAAFRSAAAQIPDQVVPEDKAWLRPVGPFVWATGMPSLAIFLLPGSDQLGCLETLLWHVLLRTNAPLAACVDAALECAGANLWSRSKRDKARIRCAISLKLVRNPSLALAKVFRNAPEIFPMDAPEFDPVARFFS